MDEPEIIVIDWNTMTVIFDNEEVHPIETMFDADGEETDDIEEAVSIVGPAPGNKWYAVAVDDYSENETVH